MAYSRENGTLTQAVSGTLNNTTPSLTFAIGGSDGQSYPSKGTNYVTAWSTAYATPELDPNSRIGVITGRTYNTLSVTWGHFGTPITAITGTPYVCLIKPDSGELMSQISNGTVATAATAGAVGTIKWDAGFIYVCVATNTWKKVAIATW